MKVGELIKVLEKVDPELPVFLQEDQEGNGYDELRCADDECAYSQEDYEIQVYSLEYSADDNGLEEEEWEDIKKNNKCVVLTP